MENIEKLQSLMTIDNKKEITDLIANYFCLDLKNREDYTICELDFTIPRIVIMDNKGVKYTVEYLKDSNLVNYSYIGELQFISITEEYPDKKIEYLYDLKHKPLVEKVSYPNGEYELSVMKEYKDVDSTHSFKRATVSYSKAIDYNNHKLMQPLLSKVTKDNYYDSSFDYRVENTYTYGDPSLVYKFNAEDNYSYQFADKIIYGTNESDQKGIVHYFCGVCFEDYRQLNRRYLPYNMDMKDFNPSSDAVKSAIIYKGGTGDAFHHILEIYKTDDNLNIKYNVGKNVKDASGSYNRVEVINRDDFYATEEGTISSDLIHFIVDTITEQFENDIFVKLVSEKLNEFAEKIDIKNKKQDEIRDSLSSSSLIDMSMDEIIKLVEEGNINYFELMERQLEKMIKMPISQIQKKEL